MYIHVSDEGNTGDVGGIQWTNTTMDIIVEASQHNPVISIVSVDDTIYCYEDIECPFINASISCRNIFSNNLTVNIQITDNIGSVTINPDGIGLIAYNIGTGSNDVIQEYYGNITNVNRAFNNFTFKSDTNLHSFIGDIIINVTNPLSGSTWITKRIVVYAVNDAPILTVPYNEVTIMEDEQLEIFGTTFSDVDIDSDNDLSSKYYVNISCDYCKLELPSNAMVMYDVQTNTDIQFYGIKDDILYAINFITYYPNEHYYGNDTISITVHDDGNEGIGGIKSDSANITIVVTPVDDPPIPTCAFASIYTVEDTNTEINGISLIDTDNIVSPLYARFTLMHGRINTSISAIQTVFTADESVNTYSWQGFVSGTYTELANILRNITYYPNSNYNQV